MRVSLDKSRIGRRPNKAQSKDVSVNSVEFIACSARQERRYEKKGSRRKTHSATKPDRSNIIQLGYSNVNIFTGMENNQTGKQYLKSVVFGRLARGRTTA